MLLTVVFVIIVQFPPSYQSRFSLISDYLTTQYLFTNKDSFTSAMVMTGVEAMAAFLRMKPTFNFFKNSSYPSFEV